MIGKIVEGHIKEALGLNSDLSSRRMLICKKCPLYSEVKVMGPMCSPYLYVNPDNGDVSYKYKKGYIKGCGCRLTSKTRLKDVECPLGKWGKEK